MELVSGIQNGTFDLKKDAENSLVYQIDDIAKCEFLAYSSSTSEGVIAVKTTEKSIDLIDYSTFKLVGRLETDQPKCICTTS